MRHLLTVLTIVLASCGTKTPDVTADIEPETFDTFFTKFKSDSLFQIERVEFPLTLVTWGTDDNLATEKVDIDNWNHLTFKYDEEIATRDTDAYTQDLKVFSDSAKVELRGVDNGIYVDYVFRKFDGRWVMTRRESSF